MSMTYETDYRSVEATDPHKFDEATRLKELESLALATRDKPINIVAQVMTARDQMLARVLIAVPPRCRRARSVLDLFEFPPNDPCIGNLDHCLDELKAAPTASIMATGWRRFGEAVRQLPGSSTAKKLAEIDSRSRAQDILDNYENGVRDLAHSAWDRFVQSLYPKEIRAGRDP